MLGAKISTVVPLVMTVETYGGEMKAVEERSSDRLLRRALSAAEDQGFYVFPVVRHGKVPAVKRWQEQATRDPMRIRGWFRRRAWNIGVATGPSRLVVVDLDDAHGVAAPEPWTGARHGRDVLALLAAAAKQPVPRQTYTVRTPSGGLHLYFRPPADVVLRNTTGTVGWKIIRGRSCFLLVSVLCRCEACEARGLIIGLRWCRRDGHRQPRCSGRIWGGLS
jgi:hypothetical protein